MAINAMVLITGIIISFGVMVFGPWFSHFYLCLFPIALLFVTRTLPHSFGYLCSISIHIAAEQLNDPNAADGFL